MDERINDSTGEDTNGLNWQQTSTKCYDGYIWEKDGVSTEILLKICSILWFSTILDFLFLFFAENHHKNFSLICIELIN